MIQAYEEKMHMGIKRGRDRLKKSCEDVMRRDMTLDRIMGRLKIKVKGDRALFRSLFSINIIVLLISYS